MFKLRKNKKGFTLVEIIIVIVIVAILAAIAVPTMLGFVEKANDQQYIAEARAAYVVAQAIAAENAAKNPANTDAPSESAIIAYLGDKAITDAKVNIVVTLTAGDNAKVESIAYTNVDGKRTVTIKSDKTVVVTKVAS